MLHLGIDTSAYTTSVALYDDSIKKYVQEKILLSVKQGEKGLRQSEAVFQHNKNLPLLLERLKDNLHSAASVSYSAYPRRVEGSYMPVFTVGEGYAKAIAYAMDVPLKAFSHQEGHVMAAMYGEEDSFNDGPFLALHLSGGTTELLLADWTKTGLSIRQIGGTLDLNFGQLIDRVGVSMQFPFPCGKYMDNGLVQADSKMAVPVKINDSLQFNISGLENKILSLPREKRISALFSTLAVLTEQWLDKAREQFCISKVLISGGVAGNSAIRSFLSEKEIIFAQRDLSSDNAVGISILGAVF